MAAIELQLAGSGPVTLTYDKLVLAGYTARNQEDVRRYVEGLRAQGIPAPARTPTLFATGCNLLTTAAEFEVVGDRTSGEAEFVMFTGGSEMYIGVGSDHTDRLLEETDIPRAKQLCAKVVSPQVWRWSEVAEHWDELVLRSWVGVEGRESLYQEGKVAKMMRPEDILAFVQTQVTGGLGHAAVFSGTLAYLDGGFKPLPYFEAELSDPRLGRSLSCVYRARPIDWLL